MGPTAESAQRSKRHGSAFTGVPIDKQPASRQRALWGLQFESRTAWLRTRLEKPEKVHQAGLRGQSEDLGLDPGRPRAEPLRVQARQATSQVRENTC